MKKKKNKIEIDIEEFFSWCFLIIVIVWIAWVSINILSMRSKVRAIESILLKKQVQETLNAYPENFDCCYSNGQRIQEN